jgi:hypothetical protein
MHSIMLAAISGKVSLVVCPLGRREAILEELIGIRDRLGASALVWLERHELGVKLSPTEDVPPSVWWTSDFLNDVLR